MTLNCYVAKIVNPPMTATVNIQRNSLSSTMATYFQSSLTLLESSSRLKNVEYKHFVLYYVLYLVISAIYLTPSTARISSGHIWSLLASNTLTYYTDICDKRNNIFTFSSTYVCTYLEYITILYKGTDWGIVTKIAVKLAARASEIKSIEPGNKTKW